MKKILFFASALAGLFFAASCQQDNLEPVATANTVTITVEAPGAINTKTIADGTNVNEVHYAVYKTNSGEDYAFDNSGNIDGPLAQGFVGMTNKVASIDFDLLQDQDYTVIFWAQVAGAGHYTLGDLRTITIEDDVVDGNDETRAAFFARYDFSTYEHKDHKVTLRRPFAQLNLLTTPESLTPVQEGQTTGYTIDVKQSEVKVMGLGKSFNTLNGIAPKADEEIVFEMAATPEEQGQETLVVNGKPYHYVSMNYFFVPEEEKLVDIKYAVVTDKGNITHEILAVPTKENYRTNVIGNLLTKETTFEIVVDAEFDGQELVEVWDEREVSEPVMNAAGEYEISFASELAWLAASVNGTLPPTTKAGSDKNNFAGKTFKLVEDIDLQGALWTPIGSTCTAKNGDVFKGTFDGNGKTIFNLNVATEGKAAAGLFANSQGYIKNLTVNGATVSGHYKTGVIVGDGLCAKIENCHVVNATVVATPYNNDDANHVGGIVGYLSAEPTAYVKNSSVADSQISGYRDVAGIAGTANKAAAVTGNTVKNVTVIADQTHEYVEAKAPNAAEVVGRVDAKATVAENTVDSNTVYILVDDAAGLQNALNNVLAGETEIRFAADIKGDVTVDQQEGKNVVINGDGKKYDGTILIDGNARSNGAETVAIKNINFETEAAELNFVEMNSTDGAVRYAHNVTIEGCTFKGGENVVGAKFRQCYNIVIKDSKVLAGHSLAQLYGCTGVTIDGVEVNAGRGVSFGTSTNCKVSDSKFVVESYGLRAEPTGALTVENTTVEAAYPVAVRKLVEGTNYDLTIKATALTSTKGYQVIFTAASDEDKFVQPAGTFTLTTDAEYFVYPGDTKIAYDTESLKAAIAAAENEETIYLANGAYFEGLFFVNGKSLNIEALGEATINGKLAIAASGKTINVNGITFENSYAGSLTSGHQYIDKSTGTYCIALYCASVNVENCTFNLSNNGGINFYAINDPEYCTVKNSTFNCNGFRPILSKVNITVDGCTFNDQYKYALQVWGNQNNGEKVIFTNNTINEAGKTSGCADVYKSYVSVSKSYDLSNVAFTISDNTPGYNFVYDNSEKVKITSCTLNGTQIVAGQCYPVASDINEVAMPYEAGWAYVTTVAGAREALATESNVKFVSDITVAKGETETNGYGVTGLYVKKGQTIDGNGKSLSVNVGGTWDSALAIKSGIVKNLKVTKGFRGIFITPGTEKVVLENVTVQGPTYTISCDKASGQGLEAYNSTFNGWTSFAGAIGTAYFEGCSFGSGAGNNFSRPYAPTTYVNCAFAAGHKIDPRAAITFENCTVDGVALTAENLSTLVTSNIANATVK